MMNSMFEAIIEELKKYLDKPDLLIDENRACLIPNEEKGVDILVSDADDGKSVMVFCQLGELSPGPFREQVFLDLLKANNLPVPRYGTFSYNLANQQIVQCEEMSYEETNGPELAEYILKFIEKAASVKDAIKNNQVPGIAQRASMRTGNIFGLS